MWLADLHWLRPYWLLSLIPLVLMLLLLWRFRNQHSPWQRLIAHHLQPQLLGGSQQPLARFALPLLAWCWLLAAIALAGPSWQRIEKPAISVNKATVLILDMSLSMYATDMTPNRLSQARFKAMDFIDALPEGELALIAFAGDAFVVSPLTPDHNNVRLQLPALTPDIMPSQGSNFLAALKEADRLLQQSGYQRGDIVALIDGFERHSERALFDQIAQMRHRLSIISFGTEEAAPVQLADGRFLRDNNNQLVLPRVPLPQLRQLAQRGGGVFSEARVSDADINAILNQPAMRGSEGAEQRLHSLGDDWQDKAVYLVWLLLPLALWLGKRGQLLILCLLFLPPGVLAEERRSWFQTDNQAAMQAYQQGDYQRAARLFRDPDWRAQAAYRAGDYATAATEWAALNEQAPSARQSHNLGNALAKQGLLEEALSAYQSALAQEPGLAEAARNAELIQQLLEEQQAEEQQPESSEEAQQQEQQQSDDGQSSDSSQDEHSSSSQDSSADGLPEPAEQQDSSESTTGEEQQAEGTEPDEGDVQQEDQASAEAGTEQEAAEQQRQIVESPWPDADPEQHQELNNMLRKVQDDPSLLLRNRLHLEHQRRRQQQLPTGAREEW